MNQNDKITEDLRILLSKYWNFDDFKGPQLEIMQSVLSKNDTLALLPTGGGKSLCFQLPGLMLGGTTIVISPLIALMNDQVQNLQKRGISAVAISAAMNFKEIDAALNNAARGHVQFLYVSPERLQNETFRQKLAYLPVTLIAVDEAHCISQWGYDFRPSYTQIAALRPFFPGITVIALTASATKSVAADICSKLEMNNPSVIRQSFTRKNLRYVVQKEGNKLPRLLKLIANLGGSGIVYLRNRKKTAELAAFLKRNGVLARAYHAGLKYEERDAVQQLWLQNKIQVICATNSFGMGIDKPDVRFVVHFDLPDSLEAYFQEAGRAGRDGAVSYATIFYTGADQERLMDNYKLAFPDPEYIKKAYQAVCNYFQIAVGAGEGMTVPFDISKVCSSYNLQPIMMYNSLRFLEKENYLSLVDGGFEPSKLMFIAGKEDIYRFELRHPRFEPLIKVLLRSYEGIFGSYVVINEKELAYRTKTGLATLTEQLTYLQKEGILVYIPQSSLPRIIFMHGRVDNRYLEFNPDNYRKLKTIHLQRIRSVIDYTDNNQVCRQVQLLMYFNEFNYAECGHCDVCIADRPKDLEGIKETIREHLSKKALTLEELHKRMGHLNDETWLKAFNQLLDDGLIRQNNSLYDLAL